MTDDTEVQVAAQNQAAADSSQAPKMIVTSGVDQDAVSGGGGVSMEDATSEAVAKHLSYVSPTDTGPEEELLQYIKGWRKAAETRFKHLLTGMANSTAEAMRYLGEAEIHLADHIAQQHSNQ